MIPKNIKKFFQKRKKRVGKSALAKYFELIKRQNKVARKRLELLSRAPEAPMLGHYTTGLQNAVPHNSKT